MLKYSISQAPTDAVVNIDTDTGSLQTQDLHNSVKTGIWIFVYNSSSLPFVVEMVTELHFFVIGS